MITRCLTIFAVACCLNLSQGDVLAKGAKHKDGRVIPTPGGVLISIGNATAPIGAPIKFVGEIVEVVTSPIFIPLEAAFVGGKKN